MPTYAYLSPNNAQLFVKNIHAAMTRVTILCGTGELLSRRSKTYLILFTTTRAVNNRSRGTAMPTSSVVSRQICDNLAGHSGYLRLGEGSGPLESPASYIPDQRWCVNATWYVLLPGVDLCTYTAVERVFA